MALLIRMKRLAAAAALVVVALVDAATPSAAQAFNEYQIKAVFLLRFAQFVEWPQGEQPDRPFVIGVLGADPFDGYLDDTVRGETIDGRPFLVKRFDDIDEVAACDILFVSDSESRNLATIVAALKDRPVLTVGDAGDFAKRGGIVQFVTEKKRVKFAINVDAARDAKLTLSSKLLRPAVIVSTRRG